MKNKIYTPTYRNDKLRCCPSFAKWQEATQMFIARNAATDRNHMNQLSAQLANEYVSHAYQAGPKTPLP